MSRSGYSDDCDGWALICWRGAVASAVRGKRGQSFLREMLSALDAMPDKKLIKHELVTPEGEVCAMGAVVKSRGLDVSKLNPDHSEGVAETLGLAEALVKEIAFENDERDPYRPETPEQRWTRMRKWVAERIKPESAIEKEAK